jgi:hypothetical protein
VISVLGAGYVLGVWTACAVFGQPQREYEDASRTSPTQGSFPIAILGDPSRPPRRRR